MKEFVESLEAFAFKICVPASLRASIVLRAQQQQAEWAECVSSEDRIEEHLSHDLPHCIMVSPSRQALEDLDAKEEEARPSKKRTFDDLDGASILDSHADSLVEFTGQPAPASGITGERPWRLGPPRAALL